METMTPDRKTADAQAALYRRYLEAHHGRVVEAEQYLRLVEHRDPFLGEIEQRKLSDACLRLMIDLSLKKAPAMDLAAAFLRFVLLVPVHMRVPFINDLASCCQQPPLALSENAWLALRKKLHTLANKTGAILYELTQEFADWKIADPAQLSMFKAPVEQQPGPVRDDGGALVDAQTGEMLEPK